MGAHCNTCTCQGSWMSRAELQQMSWDTGEPIEVDADRRRYVLRMGGGEFNAHMEES